MQFLRDFGRGSGRKARSALACEGAQAAPATGACTCCGPLVRALNTRLAADLSRRMALGGAAGMLASLLSGPAAAQGLAEPPAAPARPLHFRNLRLFDGRERRLREGVSVLVRGTRIEALPPAGAAVEGAEVIDCGGRLLMPGLIDAHWHTMLCGIGYLEALTREVPFVHLVAAREAGRTLLRGITTVRDAGGPAFAVKRAIDTGLIAGPRIYPSGAMISQTSGHADFRQRHEVPRGPASPLAQPEVAGIGMIADGEAEVLRRVREQLMLGATQIKITAGGGASSAYDPIDVTQYSEREMRAAVEAAEDWGTYVMAHVYTPRGIQRAIRAGVKSIEHGQLADEESARMMAGEGAWWSLQPFLADEDSNPKPDPESRAKGELVARGTERAYELQKRFNVRTAWGTDILFAPELTGNQLRHLAKLAPRFYEPLEALALATGHAGELLRLSGPRDPYGGPLGVVAPGALADLLVADGDPAASLDFLRDPATTLRVIVKDGRIHKNTL